MLTEQSADVPGFPGEAAQFLPDIVSKETLNKACQAEIRPGEGSVSLACVRAVSAE